MSLNSKLKDLWNKQFISFLKDPLFLSRWVSEYSHHEENRATKWVNQGYRTLVTRNEDSGGLFMFTEDIHLKIMPYHNDGFRATLRDPDPDLLRILASALADDDYQRDLDEGVQDFIRSVTQAIFNYGEAFYEIIYEKDVDGKVTSIKLRYVYSPSMRKVFGWYFQVIPWRAAKLSQIQAGIWHIPNEKILHVRAPKELGGKRGVMLLIKRLAGLNRITPDFYLETLEKEENVGFNPEHYYRERHLGVATATKDFGWNQRDYRDKYILEYYSIHRLLREANALAIIRRHILRELNSVLKIKMGIDNEIQIENLPTEQSIAVERQRLQKGDLEFVSILNNIKY